MKRTATAVIRQAEQQRIVTPLRADRVDADAGAVEALRRRLAGSTAREHVVLDFLEDDLREARAALGALARYLGEVDGALADEVPTPERLFALARAVDPVSQLDYLQTVLGSLRRRLSQVAARM